MAIPAKMIREAKELLQKNDATGIVSPRALAGAAIEGGKSLSKTLQLIAALALGGQGEGPAPAGKAAEEDEQ